MHSLSKYLGFEAIIEHVYMCTYTDSMGQNFRFTVDVLCGPVKGGGSGDSEISYTNSAFWGPLACCGSQR